MKTARYKIVGRSPLLQCNPSGMKPQKAGRKKIPSPEEEAEKGTYRLDNGQLYLKAEALRNSCVEGGKGLRLGKESCKGILRSTVFETEETCLLADPDTGIPITDYEIDTRRAVVQRQGILRSRPMIQNWATEIELEYDEDFISPEAIRDYFEIAGRRVGVGDYRPQRGGHFGRYTVTLM